MATTRTSSTRITAPMIGRRSGARQGWRPRPWVGWGRQAFSPGGQPHPPSRTDPCTDAHGWPGRPSPLRATLPAQGTRCPGRVRWSSGCSQDRVPGLPAQLHGREQGAGVEVVIPRLVDHADEALRGGVRIR